MVSLMPLREQIVAPGTRNYLSRMSPFRRFAILGLILAAGWFFLWPDSETRVPTTSRRDLTFIDYEIGNVSFSPDGRQILIGTRQIVYLHDAQDGTLLKRLWTVGYHSDWRTPTFSPDGRHFVTTPLSEAILWDLESGLQQIVFAGHAPRGWITSATFSSDGRRLVTAAEDNTARIWDTESAKPRSSWFAPIETRSAILTLAGHTRPLTSAVFNMDGRRVLTASRLDHAARLWDADTGQPIAVFSSGSSEMLQAIFSPNGRRILTLSNEQVQLWDAGTVGRCSTLTQGHIFGPSAKRPLAQTAVGLLRSVGFSLLRSAGRSRRIYPFGMQIAAKCYGLPAGSPRRCPDGPLF